MNSYHEHWHINQNVFNVNSFSGQLFQPQRVKKILQKIMVFAGDSGSLLLVNGKKGTGKSTLAQQVYYSLPVGTYEVVMCQPVKDQKQSSWLLHTFANFLGIGEKNLGSGSGLVGEIVSQLEDLQNERLKVCIVMDGGEKIANAENYHDLKALFDLQAVCDVDISCVIFSETDVSTAIGQAGMGERVKLQMELEPWSEADIAAYFDFRLKTMGLNDSVFTVDAIKLISERSKGLVGVVNAIAENCLIEAFLNQSYQVDVELLESAMDSLKHLDSAKVPHAEIAKEPNPTEVGERNNDRAELNRSDIPLSSFFKKGKLVSVHPEIGISG